MCGIAGAIDCDRLRAESMVSAINAQMHARGPDDEGTWSAPAGAGRWLALGSRRLAIIDTSASGHQPMIDEATGVVIVYNGMTYNYRSLKSDLEAVGVSFRSTCDTEVVLRLYVQRGLDALTYLEGMFGLAIWDPRSATLVLARDRLGIKPLYFAHTADRFLFGSQVRAILASGAVPLHPNAAGIAQYLATGAAADPATVVDGIEAVPAGGTLLVHGGRVDRGKFWRPGWSVVDVPWRQAVIDLRERLDASIQSHLVSDVPTGVFLSGGLDSSIIAALAARHSPDIQSVSVAFAEESYSEARFSRLAARHLGTRHQEVVLSSSDLIGMLPDVVGSMDQPTFDGINTYVVAAAAHQAGLKVALSGLGADELFDGYGMRRRAFLLSVAGRMPDSVRQAAMVFLSSRARGREDKLRAWMTHPGGVTEAYALLRSLFLPDQVDRLLSRSLSLHDMDDGLVPTVPEQPQDLAWLDMSNYMRNVLLRDSDCMSMANSLELRVPYLDNGVVDLVLSLPWRIRSRRKRLMVDAFRDLLPAEILGRPKRGFLLPIAPWMASTLGGDVAARLHESPAALQPLFDTDAVADVWDTFRATGRHWLRPWALYALFAWWSSVEAGMVARG